MRYPPRVECKRTTWPFRFAALAAAGITLWATATWWAPAIGRALVCAPSAAPSDAILVENFNAEYLLFEQARDLRRAGMGARVLVPVRVDDASGVVNDAAKLVTDVVAKVSGVGPYDVIPVREVEPIALNVARDVRQFLVRERVGSIVLVAPRFRSRRSAHVYARALNAVSIRVTCHPARSLVGVDTWPQTWHGTQQVVEQGLKLLYYRIYVLPWLADRG